MLIRADYGYVPRQWEMVLLCNDISHWLVARLESVLLTLVSWIYCICRGCILKKKKNKCFLISEVCSKEYVLAIIIYICCCSTCLCLRSVDLTMILIFWSFTSLPGFTLLWHIIFAEIGREPVLIGATWLANGAETINVNMWFKRQLLIVRPLVFIIFVNLLSLTLNTASVIFRKTS